MEHEYLKHLSKMNNTVLRDLMETYGQDVWDYAYFLTRSYHIADDVSQDVFINVYRKFDSFRGQSSVKTWLLAITRNVAFNYRKSAFIRKVTLIGFISDKGVQPSAEKQFFEQSVTNEIWKIILGLPGKFREVLVLNAKYLMSVSEISIFLGISEGTVKSRLHRARKKVLDILKEEQENERI